MYLTTRRLRLVDEQSALRGLSLDCAEYIKSALTRSNTILRQHKTVIALDLYAQNKLPPCTPAADIA